MSKKYTYFAREYPAPNGNPSRYQVEGASDDDDGIVTSAVIMCGENSALVAAAVAALLNGEIAAFKPPPEAPAEEAKLPDGWRLDRRGGAHRGAFGSHDYEHASIGDGDKLVVGQDECVSLEVVIALLRRAGYQVSKNGGAK